MTPVRTRTRAGLVTVVVTAVIALFAGPAPAAIAAAPTTCVPDPVLCPERMRVGVSVAGFPSNATAPTGRRRRRGSAVGEPGKPPVPAPTDSTGPRRARALGRYGTCR
jgi:hypothetical protein